MNPIAILREVEADVKSLGSISTDIRAKLKAGVADLTAIRDEMDTVVETVMSKAKGALASLKSVADEVSKDADEDSETGRASPTVSVADKGDNAAAPEAAPAPTEAPVDAAPSEAPAPAAPNSVNDIVAADVPEAHPDHIAAAIVAHDDAIANGSPAEVAHAEAVAGASAAGAEPEVAVKIADSVATNPPSADPAPAAL